MSILPDNSTQLEKDIVQVFVNYLDKVLRVGDPPTIPTRVLWNIDKAPLDALPNLATSLGIDLSIFNFTESQIRSYLKNAFAIAEYRGTLGGVVTFFNTLGYSVSTVQEGTADGLPTWAHYSITLDSPVSHDVAATLVNLLEKQAPLRSQLESIRFGEPLRYDGTHSYNGTQKYTGFSGYYNPKL